MKLIDGKGAIMGRVASYAAKEALKGEEVVIVNCLQIVITGNKKFILEKFRRKRKMTGSGQRGPIHSRSSEKIMKRAIRGMLPNYRTGRGREAFKRIRCYNTIPKEYEGKEFIKFEQKKFKINKLKEFA